MAKRNMLPKMHGRFKGLLIAGLMLVGVAAGATGCNIQNKLAARETLNKGVQVFTDEKYADAAKLFKTAFELDPSLYVAEKYLATAYYKQHEKNSDDDAAANNAIATFENILKRDPKDTDSIAGVAGVYQKLKRYDKAREYYLKQIDIDPKSAVGYYAVASLDWSLASPKSSAFNPDDPPSLARQTEMVDEGLQYVDKALALKPDYEEAMSFKNLLFQEKARLSVDNPEDQARYVKQAEEWYDKAIAQRSKRKPEADKAVGGAAAEK